MYVFLVDALDDDIPDVTGVKSPKETYSPQRQKMLEKLHKTISDLLQTEKDLTKVCFCIRYFAYLKYTFNIAF